MGVVGCWPGRVGGVSCEIRVEMMLVMEMHGTLLESMDGVEGRARVGGWTGVGCGTAGFGGVGGVGDGRL